MFLVVKIKLYSMNKKIETALISVTDKAGVVPFAKALQEEFGVKIISTGGTARALEQGGIQVVPVEKVTGFPEMMDGRLKSIHPNIHGGLLALRDNADHMSVAEQHGIEMIDLVAVNLYAFEATVAKEGVTYGEAIDNIDIGGPSMLRSAAKNHRFVTVIPDKEYYDIVLEEMRQTNGYTLYVTRKNLALQVFTMTANYDAAIAKWLFYH
jgi:phosphoribosylaminoimidazolecarboxamide formyltransferase/IMP cyclohydrolase